MTTHQAMAMMPLSPSGTPNRRLRRVSVIGVNGSCSTDQASGPGIDAVGTKAELRNTNSVRIIGRLLAVSTLSVTIPSATDSQLIANAVSASTPTAPSQAIGSVVGRKPTSSATTTTI